MQNVECYLPLNFVKGGNDLGVHVADVITQNDFRRGGGARLFGPITQIPGVTIERIIIPEVQAQLARLGEDPHAIVYHATPTAERAVHEQLRVAGLARTDNIIKLLRPKPLG